MPCLPPVRRNIDFLVGNRSSHRRLCSLIDGIFTEFYIVCSSAQLQTPRANPVPSNRGETYALAVALADAVTFGGSFGGICVVVFTDVAAAIFEVDAECFHPILIFIDSVARICFLILHLQWKR